MQPIWKSAVKKKIIYHYCEKKKNADYVNSWTELAFTCVLTGNVKQEEQQALYSLSLSYKT